VKIWSRSSAGRSGKLGNELVRAGDLFVVDSAGCCVEKTSSVMLHRCYVVRNGLSLCIRKQKRKRKEDID